MGAVKLRTHLIMTTINFQFPAHVPSVNEQFTRSIRFIVGFYSGTCFIRRGEFDTFERAVSKQHDLLDQGFDARVLEVNLNLYLIA